MQFRSDNGQTRGLPTEDPASSAAQNSDTAGMTNPNIKVAVNNRVKSAKDGKINIISRSDYLSSINSHKN